MSYLLVNADDFGLHDSINSAVADCVDFGSVNSISVIVNGAAPDFELLRRLRAKSIFTGIHITWIGEPWLSMPMRIASWQDLILKIFTGGRNFRLKMQTEAETQINRLIENNIQPDHIDSHQHVHHLPGIWEMSCEIMKKYNISRMRVTKVKSMGMLRKNLNGLALQTLASIKPVQKDDFFCGGIQFAGNYDETLFAGELKALSGYNTELIVHPGKNNFLLNKSYGHWNFDWEKEYAALRSEKFLTVVKENHFQMLRKSG